MKAVFLLLLVAVVLLPNVQGGRWRRKKLKPAVVQAILDAIKGGKRAMEVHDINRDGNIDMSEAKRVFQARDAEDIMSVLAEDGDSKVSVAQWQEGLENILDMAARDAEFLDDVE